MITQNRMKTVLTLAAVSMVFLVLPAAADIPGPHDLPDPDTTPPDTTKPVKVYILSGQSNMVGIGYVNDPDPGSLSTVTTAGMFPHMVDAGGAWTVRNDVWYEGVITATAKKWLTIGCGADSGKIGPELQFGHIMGYYHDEPVIILKTSQGNRSLSWDCLPPGSAQFIDGDYTYAGYGDSPNRWLTGSGPSPYGWYAGKQYDDFFLAESDMGPTGWADATDYPNGCQVRHNGVVYISKAAHTSSAASEPGIGAQSSTYWNVYSIFNVTDVLDNFASEFPQWAAQGYEIAGFVWWQGHKDQSEPHASRYEFNMVNFINEVREYYETRYPDNISPNAPFVLATIGFNGWALSGAGLTVANGQLAVSGETGNYPEFEGNVKTVESRDYWREVAQSPGNQGHHYNNNAWTYMMVGDALGRAMAELLTPYSVDAGTNMITWSGEPVELDATVQDGVTVVSYGWSADPNDGVVFSDETVEDPNVTITKDTDNPSTVKLTLTVNDEVNPPVTDSIRIDVYDDACKATIGKGLAADNPADFDGNCITNFEDLAVMATKWLNDTGLAGPQPK